LAPLPRPNRLSAFARGREISGGRSIHLLTSDSTATLLSPQFYLPLPIQDPGIPLAQILRPTGVTPKGDFLFLEIKNHCHTLPKNFQHTTLSLYDPSILVLKSIYKTKPEMLGKNQNGSLLICNELRFILRILREGNPKDFCDSSISE